MSRQEESPHVDAFLKDIFEVYERHGLAISHEDGHGAFIIELVSAENVVWLKHAQDDTPQK
jgi:hypothetical protein